MKISTLVNALTHLAQKYPDENVYLYEPDAGRLAEPDVGRCNVYTIRATRGEDVYYYEAPYEVKTDESLEEEEDEEFYTFETLPNKKSGIVLSPEFYTGSLDGWEPWNSEKD